MLPDRNVSLSEAARELGISRQLLHRVVRKQAPVGADLAVRLEAYTGCAAEVWLFLQASFDLWRARAALQRSRERSAA